MVAKIVVQASLLLSWEKGQIHTGTLCWMILCTKLLKKHSWAVHSVSSLPWEKGVSMTICIFVFLICLSWMMYIYLNSTLIVILNVYRCCHFSMLNELCTNFYVIWMLNEFWCDECWMSCLWMFLSVFVCVMSMHCVTYVYVFSPFWFLTPDQWISS